MRSEPTIDEDDMILVFLSIQAQDFIEDGITVRYGSRSAPFLSIQAQDFIEDFTYWKVHELYVRIPEHSSSGLH